MENKKKLFFALYAPKSALAINNHYKQQQKVSEAAIKEDIFH